MKNIFIMMLGIFCGSLVQAQYGIYLSYEDFLNDKMVEYPGYKRTAYAFGTYNVTFFDRDHKKFKIRIDRNEMWGYRGANDKLWRVDPKSNAYVVIEQGELILYGNYTTRITETGFTMDVNKFPLKVSKGFDGPMVRLTRKDLLEILGNDPKAQEILEEIGKGDLVDFVYAYNVAME